MVGLVALPPVNPMNLKDEVFRRAVKRFGGSIPLANVFKAIEVFRDPHISIAGFVAGAIEKALRLFSLEVPRCALFWQYLRGWI